MALSVMAVLALLSWRVVDGMVTTQTVTRSHSQHWLNWQTALAQWQTDLDAATDTPTTAPIDFDGRVLRVTRRDTSQPDQPALRVVAWALKPATVHTDEGGDPTNLPVLHLWRWASPPLRDAAALASAWNAAQTWGQNTGNTPDAQALPLLPVQAWTLYYHLGGTWTNPLSATGTDNTPQPRRAPDGVRLTLTLPDTGPASGTLTKDWGNPLLGGDKTQ